MHDIDFIRKNPTLFNDAMQRRGLGVPAENILAMDRKRRQIQTQRDEQLARRNDLSKQIGGLKQQGKDADAQILVAEVQKLKAKIQQLETAQQEEAMRLKSCLEILPNMPATDVPDGADESDNVLLHQYGEAKILDFPAKQHFDLGEELGLLDFHYAIKISGARFVVKYGALARLERAIANFMLDIHIQQNAYLEVDSPVLVHGDTLYGSGHLPKFSAELYKIAGEELYLIPTAETVLANYAAGKILSPEKLPIRLVSWTNCFRSEAGAAGRDTRGLIRMHQFSKVELVSIVVAEESGNELERMLKAAEGILEKLELPYRTVTLCVGDMGFAATKTYDIEVWLAGAGTYREISSCSNCLDFQSRRMNARIRTRTKGKGTEFPHMLNGSGLAVGRTMVAILENYQNKDGSITIPDCLRPYMGGQDQIRALKFE